MLTPGERFTFIPVDAEAEWPGGRGHASVNCPTLGQIAQIGDVVLLDDGALCLRVGAIENGAVTCRVEVGGPLPERSGFNLPG
jgi:pyruvate kinase